MENQPIDVEYLGISKIGKNYAISFNWLDSDKKFKKQWVAKITGICHKFGFKREFMPSTKREVENRPDLRAFKWELPLGHIYQYKNFLVDVREDYFAEGFFILTMNGLIPIEMDQVRVYLNMPVKNRLLVKPITFKKSDGEYVADDVPF